MSSYDYAWRKRYTYDRARGIQRTTPAGPVRDHIARLRDHGWSWHAIGRAAGIGLTTPHVIAHSDRPRVRTVTAQRILAIRPEKSAGEAFVDAVGTRRRIKALLALGWPHAELRGRSGVTTRDVLNQGGNWVSAATRDAVARLYEQLSMTHGPSKKTRERAQRFGYLPPLAYDDATIDDPSPRIDERARKNTAEVYAA